MRERARGYAMGDWKADLDALMTETRAFTSAINDK